MTPERELAALEELLPRYRAGVAEDPRLAGVIRIYEERAEVLRIELAAERATHEAALDDFNYVGSRHHY